MAATIACSVDDRAYDGSRQDKSFDESLRQFGLSLPECADGIGFWASDDLNDELYIRFTASDSCGQQFLAGHGLRDGEQIGLLTVALAVNDRARSLGWRMDPSATHVRYQGSPPTRNDVDLEVIVEQPARTYYVYAFEL